MYLTRVILGENMLLKYKSEMLKSSVFLSVMKQIRINAEMHSDDGISFVSTSALRIQAPFRPWASANQSGGVCSDSESAGGSSESRSMDSPTASPGRTWQESFIH